MATCERYVVVIGETGSGKSTFINYVANYFHKGSLHCPYIAIPTTYQVANMHYIHNEHSVGDRTRSKTVDCQRYSFRLSGVHFHFIDTPGVNDTGGYAQDIHNVDKVFSHIENISELNAVILILNGAVARLTINIKHVLATYRDRLPDAIYSNIIIILTNCEEHTVNFSPADAGLSEQCPVFHMQNSAFSSDPATRSASATNLLQRHFDFSMNAMDRIVKKLLSLKPTSTKLFKDMSDDRNRIKEQLQLARMTILDLQNMDGELAAFELSANIHAANAEKFRNFFQERTVVQNQRIKTNHYNTICMTCESVCHENCSIKEVSTPGSSTLFHCSSMDSNGQCYKCPKRCIALMHFHERFIFKKCKIPAVTVIESMQQRFLQARDGQKAAHLKCDNLQNSKVVLEYALQDQYNEVKESIRKLQETCRDSNVTTILYQFIELLEKDASSLKSSSVIEKSRRFIAQLKQLCFAPEKSNNMQAAACPRVSESEQHTTRRSFEHPKPRDANDTPAGDETRDQDLPHRCNVNGTHSPQTLFSSSRTQPERKSITNSDYDGNDEYHDPLVIETTVVSPGLIDESKGSRREDALQQQQNAAGEPPRFTHERGRENIVMVPWEELLRLVNTDIDHLTQTDIRVELELRCSGESIGFLTCSEQILLCDEYVKYQQTTFKDLLRLSLNLIDDINGITDGDPFKINLIPLEKRLQLCAINLRIKKKN